MKDSSPKHFENSTEEPQKAPNEQAPKTSTRKSKKHQLPLKRTHSSSKKFKSGCFLIKKRMKNRSLEEPSLEDTLSESPSLSRNEEYCSVFLSEPKKLQNPFNKVSSKSPKPTQQVKSIPTLEVRSNPFLRKKTPVAPTPKANFQEKPPEPLLDMEKIIERDMQLALELSKEPETIREKLDISQIPILPYSPAPNRDSECIICRYEFLESEEVMALLCSHLFHPKCLKPWLEYNSKCPVCREILKH